MRKKSYSELIRISSFEERLEYLRLHGSVGAETFGFDRYINQRFYLSPEWKDVRSKVIVRDEGCDLGVRGYDIYDNLLVHHMNPMTMDDIVHGEAWILDPEYLITTTHRTHNAIHYGFQSQVPAAVVSRAPGDTQLW